METEAAKTILQRSAFLKASHTPSRSKIETGRNEAKTHKKTVSLEQRLTREPITRGKVKRSLKKVPSFKLNTFFI